VITATYLRKLLLSILGKPTLTHVVPLNPKVLGSIPGAGTSLVDLALFEYDSGPSRHTPGDLQACSIGLSIV
jgi:hypothetical protein